MMAGQVWIERGTGGEARAERSAGRAAARVAAPVRAVRSAEEVAGRRILPCRGGWRREKKRAGRPSVEKPDAVSAPTRPRRQCSGAAHSAAVARARWAGAETFRAVSHAGVRCSRDTARARPAGALDTHADRRRWMVRLGAGHVICGERRPAPRRLAQAGRATCHPHAGACHFNVQTSIGT